MKIDEKAIGMYEDDFFSMQMIGEFFGCSRQAVKKFLNKRGIDTRKRRFDLVCDICGKGFKRHRAYIRNTLNPVCSPECYYKRIHNPDYNQNRQGQRNARRVADELLISIGKRLMPENVVHHEDGNTENNDPKNLKVFKSNSDHMKYHRGDKRSVTPILDCGKIQITSGLKEVELSVRAKYKLKFPNQLCPKCKEKNSDCYCKE